MNKIKLSSMVCVLSLMGLHMDNCMAESVSGSWLRATQWVKIISSDNTIAYETLIYNLKHSIIPCGKGCQIIKLSNTPFTNDGELRMNVNFSYCMLSDLHHVVLPFNSTSNGYLYTPNKVYNLTVDDSCYSSTQRRDVVLNVTVSGNPLSGYEIVIGREKK